MITDRWMVPSDLTTVALSLAKDEHHKETEPEFFMEPGTVTKVYEDNGEPVMFVRGSKTLRIDIQYVNNDDTKRNMRVMLEGFDKLSQKAKENGFTEVIFNTNNSLLRKFCVKRFGFVESNNELRKFI